MISCSWVRAAASTSSEPPMVRAIRSETSRPASRRACWTCADQVAGQALGGELGRDLGVEHDEAAAAQHAGRGAAVGRSRRRSRGEYSPSSSASPPAVTVPSSATDQSPDFEPLIASCTSLPSRGPAARALTVSFCSTPYAAASSDSAASSRTSLTLTSSRTIALEAGQRGRVGHDDGQRRERQPVAQVAGLAQRRRRRADLADLVHRGDQGIVGRQLVDAAASRRGAPSGRRSGRARPPRSSAASAETSPGRRPRAPCRACRRRPGCRPRSGRASGGCTSSSARRGTTGSRRTRRPRRTPSSAVVISSTKSRHLASR